MDTRTEHVYEYAAYYDSLFDRNYAAECDFLVACREKYSRSRSQSFIELGCGPARNARELSRRGWKTGGLDLSANMLAYAGREAAREGVPLELVHSDFTDFALPAPVAMAACLWDTIYSVPTNDAMLRHLRAVARNLESGGIYVIETSHPRYLRERYCGHIYRGRSGKTDIELTWGLPEDRYDSIEQQWNITILLEAREAGVLIARNLSHLIQRWYACQELRALIDLSGAFSETHFLGRTGLPLIPLSDDPVCDAMIVVLVKS